MTEKRLLVTLADELPLSRIERLRITAVACQERLFDRSLRGVEWLDIDAHREIANVQEAYTVTEKIYAGRFADGSSVSQEITYGGHELLWYFQQLAYIQHVMPFLEWRRLLYLFQGYDAVYAHGTSGMLAELFRMYCLAFDTRFGALHSLGSRSKTWVLPVYRRAVWFVPLLVSLLSWPVLMVRRPKILLWQGSDYITSNDYDFRLEHIYKELRTRDIHFVEFIRAIQPPRTLIKNIWIRRRAVVYHNMIVQLVPFIPAIRYLLAKRRVWRKLPDLVDQESGTTRFFLLLAIKQFHSCFSLQTSAQLLRIVVRSIGIKAFVSTEAVSRNAEVLLACKLAGVPTIGIQSANAVRYFVIDDYLPGFQGTQLSPAFDEFGLWSPYWRDYVIKHSHIYRGENTFVSGPLRPLQLDHDRLDGRLGDGTGEPHTRVLLISEPLTDPGEIVPFVEEISRSESMSISIKCRPERNDNIVPATRHLPNVALFTGTLTEAYGTCDVVLGSHSTAILEAAIALKPIVLLSTRKWGDYYDNKVDKIGEFVGQPRDLTAAINSAVRTPLLELRRRRDRLWGDSQLNGAATVVDRLERILTDDGFCT